MYSDRTQPWVRPEGCPCSTILYLPVVDGDEKGFQPVGISRTTKPGAGGLAPDSRITGAPHTAFLRASGMGLPEWGFQKGTELSPNGNRQRWGRIHSVSGRFYLLPGNSVRAIQNGQCRTGNAERAIQNEQLRTSSSRRNSFPLAARLTAAAVALIVPASPDELFGLPVASGYPL